MRKLERFGIWLKEYFAGWRITKVDAAVFLLLMLAGCAFAGTELVRDMTRKEGLLGQIHSVNTEEVVYVEGKVLIDINHAGAEGLAALPGIGETLAGRIIAYREENGPFSSVEELKNVYGIGEGTMEALRSRVVVK